MATFAKITDLEMSDFLIKENGFRRLSLPGVIEAVYGKRVDKNGIPLTIRVFTSIDPLGLVRDIGKDAIRVALFTLGADGQPKMVTGTKRVHRVSGWKNNLKKRITELEAYQPTKCPKCGGLMVVREYKGREFLGCSNYPNCKNTQQVSS